MTTLKERLAILEARQKILLYVVSTQLGITVVPQAGDIIFKIFSVLF